LADSGHAGARTVLRLIEDPSRFLSTVQIGITLVGILAGAFGGATIAERLGGWLNSFEAVDPYGETIAMAVVVVAITYLSLIVGELVPKRIALSNPEGVASAMARPMEILSRVAAPAVWLLKTSTDAALTLLRLGGTREAVVTEDEVKSLIAEGVRTGIFAPQERQMIDGVLRLADRPVRVIMTPRSEVAWIDVNADRQTVADLLDKRRYSRLLICDGSVDRAVGVIHTKDLLPAALAGDPLNLRDLMAPALLVPEGTGCLRLIDRFRREGVHMAVVIDEYGLTEGIVTLTDVLESIAGDLPERGEAAEDLIVQRPDGSWLVDGMMPLDEFQDRLEIRDLREGGDFHTVAGLVLQRLAHLPTTGESFSYRGLHFEIVDMDGRRIDKVLVRVEAEDLED
jgi:putative hemolysin